ncbi:class I SAM-dependent methyltransferase [Streptosporangium lutulentum]
MGAGGGSVALWLAERVAPTGSVLATDIKPGLIPRRPGLTVAQHDIVNDPLPESAFDLIHARLVLSHLPRRRQVLERLRTVLRPGGWLQIDEIDITHWVAPPTLGPRVRDLYGAYVAAMTRVLSAAGSDPTWGRSAARDMKEAGLVEVDPVCWTEMWGPGSPGVGLLISNSLHLEDRLLEAGMTRSCSGRFARSWRIPSSGRRPSPSTRFSPADRREPRGGRRTVSSPARRAARAVRPWP